METRLLQTQQFRNLAALLDNLTDLLNGWVQIVSKVSFEQDTPTDDEGVNNFIFKMQTFQIPLEAEESQFVQPVINKDEFMDELASLSSLELPDMTSFHSASLSELDALKELERFTSNTPPLSPQPERIDDLASLTLPENFDNFFPQEKSNSSKRRTAGGYKRIGRISKKTKLSSFSEYGVYDNINEPPPPKDEFGLSSLEKLSATLGDFDIGSLGINEPALAPTLTNSKVMSYDDFFRGLTSATAEPSSVVDISPRGDKVIAAFGVREDMNKRGMTRVKKKTQLDAKGKGVYQMEDAYSATFPFNSESTQGLFCVFDGHVDKNAAIAATKLFPEELLNNLEKFPVSTDCGELIRETFLSTDKRMIQYDTEGCTATAVWFWEYEGTRYVQTGNVGDSTAFLCRNNTAIMLSKDHKVNEPSERKRLLEAGLDLNVGQSRINGLAVSRALGDHFIKDNFPGVTAEPFLSDVYELDDETDSLLIVASDGLWDTMSGQDAMDAVKKMKDPQGIANTLVTMALSSGLCTDNITVIAIRL